MSQQDSSQADRGRSAKIPSTKDATVRAEDLESLEAQVRRADAGLSWTCPFVLPGWMKAWWSCFSGSWEPYVHCVHHNGSLAGIAPLMRHGSQVRLVGDEEVCDHLDVAVVPRYGERFARYLLDHLAQDGVRQLVLSPIRDDAAAAEHLLPAAERWGARISCEQTGQLYTMPLPASWQAYLQRLSAKERHEIRRKLRRLHAAGQVTLRCVDNAAAVPDAMQVFVSLFRANRSDKAAFMTGSMPAFFQRLAFNLASAGLLRLYFLDLDGRTIAATFCIVHRSTVYLYNNGYDANYRSLSVGLLSKVLTIRESIRSGWRTYDFLKGAEAYKRRLGGQPTALHRCVVELDR